MIILRQKNYNIISDIRYSGIKRTLRKNVGRARRKMAGNIDKSIERDLINKRVAENKGKELSKELHRISETTDPAKKKLEEISKSGKIEVRYDPLGPNLSPNGKSLGVPENVSLGELGHELGHLKNSNGSNGKVFKLINNIGQSKKSLDELKIIDSIKDYPIIATKRGRSLISNSNIRENTNKFFESDNLTESAKRFIRGRLLVQDEKNASKWALKRIKNKLSPKVYKLEKNRQKAANDTYKHAIKVSSKIPLRNKIQIPSKKGDFKFEVND